VTKIRFVVDEGDIEDYNDIFFPCSAIHSRNGLLAFRIHADSPIL